MEPQPVHSTDDNSETIVDVPEPFSVDIFSERLRFSRPHGVQALHHLYRWTVYIFLPFFIRLIPTGLAVVYVIIYPIKMPPDIIGGVNIIAIIFFGVVIPGMLLAAWYRSIPWWFLNGTERCWQTFQMIAEENGHRFPEDFWHPFIHHKEFGLEEDTFADELIINSETDIEGFIGADINISYHDKLVYLKTLRKTMAESFGLYLDSAYWKQEDLGLRFYGERMNIYVPYGAIKTVRKGLLWCNIVLKLDTTVTGRWTEICISLGHLPTMRGDRMLRDVLYERIAISHNAAKIADLIEQLDLAEQSTDDA